MLLSCEKLDVKYRDRDLAGEQSENADNFVAPAARRITTSENDAIHILLEDGRIFSWGGNWDGQLLDGTTTSSPIPVEANLTAYGITNNFKTLSYSGSYSYHVCAIHNSGKLYCWGSNWSGECGIGVTDTTTLCYDLTEVRMDHTVYANDFLQVSTGQEVTCALHSNKKIYCWGNSGSGRVGDGTNGPFDALLPQEIDMSVAGETNEFKFVHANEWNGCGVHISGKIFCWGWNSNGVIGNGTISSAALPPTEIDMSSHPEENDFVQVVTGFHACGLHASGKVFCWGENGSGTSGNGTTTDTSSPVEIDMGLTGKANNFTELFTNYDSMCALHQDGTLYCWGYNSSGEYLTGDTSDKDRPVLYDMSAEPISNNIKTAGMSAWAVCVHHENDKFYCSGYNWAGLGDAGGTQSSLVPLEVDTSNF